jgi:hypothetical protein
MARPLDLNDKVAFSQLTAVPDPFVCFAEVKTSGFPERYDRNGDVATYTTLKGRRSVSMLRDKPGGSSSNREARPRCLAVQLA